MSKPAFDETKPFQAVDKPAFDESAPFEAAPAVQSAPEPGMLEKFGRATVNALPVMGGIVGGVLGTPADIVSGPGGNIAGAAIGGTMGAALKNAINSRIDPENAPKTATEAFTNPLVEGATQGALQGVGEVAAPLVSGALGKLSKPVADYLSKLAEKQAVKATGVTGNTVYNKFSDNAGRELLDRGIVKFGNNQAQIAANARGALDASGQSIGDSLKALDDTGATVSRDDLLAGLQQKIADMKGSPSQAATSKQIGSVAEDVAAGPEQYTLSQAEAEKRGFQGKVNWNNPEGNASNAAASDVFKNAVEDNATKANPDLASDFQDAKDTYGLLSPITEATEKKAAQATQSHGVNLHSIGGTGIGAVTGGIAGYQHGGLEGAAKGALAGALVGGLGKRIPASTAVTADWLGNAIRNAPTAFGKWAPALSQAASRGTNSLNATDYILQQTDPEYREHRKALQSDENE